MLLPFLLTAVLSVAHAQQTLQRDVDYFVANFRRLNHTEDINSVVYRLEGIARETRYLFKLGRPVVLLLLGYNATGKVTDEETTALSTLHQLFDHSFEGEPRNEPTEYSSTLTHTGFPTSTYLEEMRTYVATLTNATARHESGRHTLEYMKEARIHRSTVFEFDPMGVLDMIDTYARFGCEMPTKSGIVALTRLQDALRRVRAIIDDYTLWNLEEHYMAWNYYKNANHMISSDVIEEQAEKLIKKLNDANLTDVASVQSILVEGYTAMSPYQSTKPGVTECMLEEMYDRKFNQTVLLVKLQSLHRDLIRIALLEWTLSAISGVDDEYYSRDADITAMMIDRTASFLAKWTRTIQSVTWPEIGVEYAKRTIEQNIETINSYNETARKVQKAFEDHGSLHYHYEVVVAPTSEVGVSWSVASTNMGDYTNITNFHGLDVHIFRNGAFDKTSTVLSYLQRESSIGPFYSEGLFRSVLLLKKRNSTLPNIAMPIGFAAGANWAMLLLALLITALLSVGQAERNLTADVRAFVSKYRQLNSTWDVVRALERIGDDTRELFRLGQPVGELLVKFNSTGKATAEETQALAELHKLFDHSYGRANPLRHTDSFYLENYGWMLEHMRQYAAKITNATARSKEGYNSVVFIKMGRMHPGDGFDPLRALSSIDNYSRFGCRMPTKERIRTLCGLQEALRRVENIARESWDEGEFELLDSFKQRVFYMISSTSNAEHAEKLTKQLNEVNATTPAPVLELLTDGYSEMADNYTVVDEITVCLLEATMDASKFNQIVLYEKLSSLHSELVRIALLEWAFSSIAELEYDEEYYNKDAEIVALSVEKTASFLVKWTKTVQKVAWPEIGIEFAKQAIERSDLPVNTYNEIAKLVHAAFLEHGSPSYQYQVLVVPTSDWSVKTLRNDDYVNITGFHGLDIHVFRYLIADAVSKSDKSRLWMQDNEESILREIRNGAFADPSTVLSKLQTEASQSPLIKEDRFSSVVLLKKTIMAQASSNSTEIPVGFYAVTERFCYKLETSRTSYSVLEHGRETTYLWKAFFFV